MKLAEQLGENSFDAGAVSSSSAFTVRPTDSNHIAPLLSHPVYAFEATCHAPSLEGVYREIYKVLKPGGVTGILEWVMVSRLALS